MSRKIKLTADTPLSALIRESHHEALRAVIETWRPCLCHDDKKTDSLRLSRFVFDFSQMSQRDVYWRLAVLINNEALCGPMTTLAAYLADHSNLSANARSIYRQLSRYCQHHR